MGILRHYISIILPACGMMMLILDSQTAMHGAAQGIVLCINSVVPSLFPFFVLSILLTNRVLNSHGQAKWESNTKQKSQQPAKTLFIAGLLGGYPTGAQAVMEAFRNGSLPEKNAHRLLGFCSNAGPAFIFGITGRLFSACYIPWLLWLIHILSALIVSVMIPVQTESLTGHKHGAQITLQQAFNKSLYTISSVCGWIILFRVLIAFIDRWFLWLFPIAARPLIFGTLELTNGIILLQEVDSEALRFIYCSILISFGGCCVGMQTASVTRELGTGWYFPGKIMQSTISGILSLLAAKVIYDFPLDEFMTFIIVAIAALSLPLTITIKKFCVAFSCKSVYNNQKSSRELLLCSFGKK